MINLMWLNNKDENNSRLLAKILAWLPVTIVPGSRPFRLLWWAVSIITLYSTLVLQSIYNSHKPGSQYNAQSQSSIGVKMGTDVMLR